MKGYIIEVKGKGESPLRGAQPENTEVLLERNKDTTELRMKILKEGIGQLLSDGDVVAALAALREFETKEMAGYSNPLNVFQKDVQNGMAPYIGGQCPLGALRNTARDVYPKYFWENKQGQNKKPAAKHFRKSVKIRPYHIFIMRNGGQILKPDRIVGQSPSEQVKGFARYEQIDLPWEILFNVLIVPQGRFEALFKNKENIVELIKLAAFHGLAGARGAGYGQWMVIDTKIKNSLAA